MHSLNNLNNLRVTTKMATDEDRPLPPVDTVIVENDACVYRFLPIEQRNFIDDLKGRVEYLEMAPLTEYFLSYITFFTDAEDKVSFAHRSVYMHPTDSLAKSTDSSTYHEIIIHGPGEHDTGPVFGGSAAYIVFLKSDGSYTAVSRQSLKEWLENCEKEHQRYVYGHDHSNMRIIRIPQDALDSAYTLEYIRFY